MREGLVPVQSSDAMTPGTYGNERAGALPEQGPLDRPLAALRRYKWLVLAITLTSSALGVLGTKLITPEYEVRATVWVSSAPARGGGGADRTGPIRSAELLNAGAWIELFRSYRVVDEVVRQLVLYVRTETPTDKPLFAQFGLADRFAPGQYDLNIDRAKKQWVLSNVAGLEVDRGTSTDSIGRKVGFTWQLPESVFEGQG